MKILVTDGYVTIKRKLYKHGDMVVATKEECTSLIKSGAAREYETTRPVDIEEPETEGMSLPEPDIKGAKVK